MLGACAFGVLGGCASLRYEPGRYAGELASGSAGAPGIEFAFDLERAPGGVWSATLLNGPERIEVPEVRVVERRLTMRFPHDDSAVEVKLREQTDKRTRGEGSWRVKRPGGEMAAVAVSVERRPWMAGSRPPAIVADRGAGATVGGRWALEFELSGPAVGEFEITNTGEATGIVRTATGEYRGLAGRYEPTLRRWGPRDERRADDIMGSLEVSTFDGAHAYGLYGDLQRDGRLRGVFVSGNWFVEAFTGVRDAGAAAPTEPGRGG